MKMSEHPEKNDKLDYFHQISSGAFVKPYMVVVPPGMLLSVETITSALESGQVNQVLGLGTSDWEFPGKEGLKTSVVVCSNGDEVELFVNGESCGKKPSGKAHGYLTIFEVHYEPGVIEAINYHNKMEYSRAVLHSQKNRGRSW